MKKKCLRIATLAHTIYKRCECCNRVKDIYFKISILDSAEANFLVGDLDLCKTCGQNLGDILTIRVSTENVLTDKRNNFSENELKEILMYWMKHMKHTLS